MSSNTNLSGNWWDTEVGHEILSKKYFHDGEDFNGFTKRVSSIFSEGLQDSIRDAILNADFLPAGRALYGAGSKGKFKASLSNCYILESPKDNIEDIFDIAKKMARIFSYGGGCGLNVSNLRPRDSKVHNSAKTSTGAVSFLSIFNSVGEVIGSNNRRAALMLGLECTHPDLEEFLTVKQNNTAIQAANLSILFTDEFMDAVKHKQKFDLKFKVEATGEVVSKTIDAHDFFMKFCTAQWDYAEPGALYIDRIRNYNILSGYPEEEYKIDICNPCAEYTGSAWNACNLGSINLYNVVSKPFTSKAHVDVAKLQKLTELGVKALDETLDYGYDMQPLPENRKAIDDWRAIGLGVFGLADALVALGIRYGSKESIDAVTTIMSTMINTAVKTSALLAKDKGSFSKYNWKHISNSDFMHTAITKETYELVQKYGLRNGSLLSVAPTGSIATMCGLSGGVEPLYQIQYERTTHAMEKTGRTFKVFAKSVEHLLKTKELPEDTDVKQRFPYVIESHDVLPKDRVKLQASMQKYVDNAISSTINLKHEATVSDVFDTYCAAWHEGCKGITIFRDGCARTSILGKQEEETEVLDMIEPKKRRNYKKLNGVTLKKSSSCANPMYITINTKAKEIFEIFVNASGGCKSNISTITRLVSLALRSGIKVETITEELKENQCPACQVLRQQGNTDVSASCGTCLAEAIEEVYAELKKPHKKDTSGLLKCPSCGKKTLRPEGKCATCQNCGWSKCN